MYTQCPACKTVFGINEHIIAAAGGMVCCSQCSHTYDARETLMEELPEIPAATRTIERAMSDEPAEEPAAGDGAAITVQDEPQTDVMPPDDAPLPAETPAAMVRENTHEDLPLSEPENEAAAEIAQENITDAMPAAEAETVTDTLPELAAADTLTSATEETTAETTNDFAEEDDLVALATRSFEHAALADDTVAETTSQGAAAADTGETSSFLVAEDLTPDAVVPDQEAMAALDTSADATGSAADMNTADNTTPETEQPGDNEIADVIETSADITTAESSLTDAGDNAQDETYAAAETRTDDSESGIQLPEEDTTAAMGSEAVDDEAPAEETPSPGDVIPAENHADEETTTDTSATIEEAVPAAEDTVTDDDQPAPQASEEPVLTETSTGDVGTGGSADTGADVPAEEIEPVLDATADEQREEELATSADESIHEEEEPEAAAMSGTREDRLAARYLERVLGEREDENKHAYGWAFGIVLLIIVLSAQYAYLIRDNLAQSPNLRPWAEKLCEVAGCHLPLRKDLAKLKLIQQDVRSHPDKKNVLLINAVFVNTASFPQAYPGLRFRLSDVNERPVGERVFTPQEYLAKTVDTDAGMEPQVPVHAVFELIDPGKDAVNYEFDFR